MSRGTLSQSTRLFQPGEGQISVDPPGCPFTIGDRCRAARGRTDRDPALGAARCCCRCCCCSSGRWREPCVTSSSSSSWRCSSPCSSTRSSAGWVGPGSRVERRLRSSISPSQRSSHWRSSLSPRWSCSRRAAPPTGWTSTLRPIPDTRRGRAPSKISARFQGWLDHHHLGSVHVQRQGQKFLNQVGTKDVQKYTTRALQLGRGCRGHRRHPPLRRVPRRRRLDLHAARHAAVDGGGRPTIPAARPRRADRADGASGRELRQGAVPPLADHRRQRRGRAVDPRRWSAWCRTAASIAAAFGAWAAVTELIPYVGPWLGASPPVLYALVQHPLSALWVALLFLGIQQLEGHVVVPKVMGSTLRLHPLLVIFGLLAGGEIYGFAGDPRRPAAARGRARCVGVLLGAGRARELAHRHAARRDRRRAEGAGCAETSARADRLNERRRTIRA